MHEEAAIIKDFDIFIEDHGLLTFFITVDYDDYGTQGIGGYCLDTVESDADGKFVRRIGHRAGSDIILAVCRAFNVTNPFTQLKGKPCFVLKERAGSNEKVLGIRGFKGKKDSIIFSEIFHD